MICKKMDFQKKIFLNNPSELGRSSWLNEQLTGWLKKEAVS